MPSHREEFEAIFRDVAAAAPEGYQPILILVNPKTGHVALEIGVQGEWSLDASLMPDFLRKLAAAVQAHDNAELN